MHQEVLSCYMILGSQHMDKFHIWVICSVVCSQLLCTASQHIEATSALLVFTVPNIVQLHCACASCSREACVGTVYMFTLSVKSGWRISWVFTSDWLWIPGAGSHLFLLQTVIHEWLLHDHQQALRYTWFLLMLRSTWSTCFKCQLWHIRGFDVFSCVHRVIINTTYQAYTCWMVYI